MARPVHAALLPLLLAACLLFQLADCSRPPPSSPEKPRNHAAAVVPRPALPRDAPHEHDATESDESTSRARSEDGATTTSSSSSATTTSFVLRGNAYHHDGSVSGGISQSAAEGVVEGGDSAAGPSCHSNDVHNRPCPPASKG
ncbi:hypothetical protein PR202_ga13226 [Eleusine coracana subsp. coracana]|uniref:Uncharacterized protein n=1 Tax=Eleusine coracana subsp. coracana TaxID=191504 RepID=A0AAV5CDJ5_ELECO|nr:hypothetical protein PR202_ga13226 [Eleusine coracana subsp. coracana]